jgi:hypothetical protein
MNVRVRQQPVDHDGVEVVEPGPGPGVGRSPNIIMDRGARKDSPIFTNIHLLNGLNAQCQPTQGIIPAIATRFWAEGWTSMDTRLLMLLWFFDEDRDIRHWEMYSDSIRDSRYKLLPTRRTIVAGPTRIALVGTKSSCVACIIVRLNAGTHISSSQAADGFSLALSPRLVPCPPKAASKFPYPMMLLPSFIASLKTPASRTN